ncbi:glucose-1-phosphate adenylyltransferase related protein [Candidatus Ruthia magnifica str. Cm (Calyptogena magnifica)]|uniref:Glucose-1-phosphate adenylyltransferase related protein n=1 Tax=Ruthia magnifica subsp. Calyptogena magnifica TaxID=413404 RepID=A1AXF5_RUTMC|nr:cupin [Candidatus Ruthturnera calyptogenae]ABL02612.1 glucose-1-phosphate adenylyltransferase related protein [Candidatus Ruthia magnifica str. Cm (Calyptogena magnifica)]
MELVTTKKPWGKEDLLEKNEKYVFKKLTMYKGHACSLQYHEIKTETVYLLIGSLKVYIGDKIDELDEVVMKPNSYLTLYPFKIHRMEALEDSIYFEISTPELKDVVRLQDRYKRD